MRTSAPPPIAPATTSRPQRDDVEGYWPPIPDHWVAYGLAETVEFPERDPDQPLTKAELAYARSQASLFGGQVRWVSQQAGPWGRLVRGTHIVRGGGYGVVGEALTGLWRVAEADSRLADLRAPIAERAKCMAGLAEGVQRSEPTDPRADGAWFVRGVTRMDDQQHATSALLRTLAIVDAQNVNGSDDAPSSWLWALALIATFNPLFVALALPRRETRKERATLAAVGGRAGIAHHPRRRPVLGTAVRRARRQPSRRRELRSASSPPVPGSCGCSVASRRRNPHRAT